VKASLKAKNEWYRRESQRRRKENQWVQACDREACLSTISTLKQPHCKRKCASVSTTLRHRVPVQIKRTQINITTWLQQIGAQIASMNQRAKRATQSKWALKCETTARNLRGRAERKQQPRN
jgi:hypothetical protein